MKNIIICLVFSSIAYQLHAQRTAPDTPGANIRLSFLLLPFSPLLTVEVKTLGNVTVQVETNFVNTHGVNFKYFTKKQIDGNYVFVGTAFVENKLLRKDLQATILPYLGYGYAHRFGKAKAWTFDTRFGIGATTNADSDGVYPVIKTGIGRIF